MSKKYLAVLLFLVLLASVPRAVELISNNYIFGYDQGRDLLAAKKIIFDHKLTLIGAEVGGQGGFFMGPGWYYLLTIPTFIMHGDPYGAMVLIFLVSIGVLVSAFFFTKRMFDIKTAFIVTFLLAVSPRLIDQARLLWAPYPISLLTVFFLFFLFKVLQKKHIYLLFLTFTVGLMFHFEPATAAAILFELIILSPFLFIKKLTTIRSLVIAFGTFLVSLFPLLLFDLRHEFLISKGLLGVITYSNVDPSHQVIQKYIEPIFINHLEVFRNNFISTFQKGDIAMPFIMVVFLVGTILYLRDKKNAKEKKYFVLFLFISPFIIFAANMLYLWPMWDWWILNLNVTYCFLFGILLVYLWRNIKFRLIAVVLLLVFMEQFIQRTIQFYTYDLTDFGGIHKVKGKLEAINYIFTSGANEKFGLLIFSPAIYTDAYDYLIWWKGIKDYNYVPHREKKGIFYLLIEPDPFKPWTYKGWLETVIKSGTIEREVKLPSGFIIEKRREHEL